MTPISRYFNRCFLSTMLFTMNRMPRNPEVSMFLEGRNFPSGRSIPFTSIEGKAYDGASAERFGASQAAH